MLDMDGLCSLMMVRFTAVAPDVSFGSNTFSLCV